MRIQVGIKHVSASDLTGERGVYLKRQNKEGQITGEWHRQVWLWKGFGNKRKEQRIRSFLWVPERHLGVWPGSSQLGPAPPAGARKVILGNTGRWHRPALNQGVRTRFPFAMILP